MVKHSDLSRHKKRIKHRKEAYPKNKNHIRYECSDQLQPTFLKDRQDSCVSTIKKKRYLFFSFFSNSRTHGWSKKFFQINIHSEDIKSNSHQNGNDNEISYYKHKIIKPNLLLIGKHVCDASNAKHIQLGSRITENPL